MDKELEWVTVTSNQNSNAIGAVGFDGGQAVVIATFLDDRDWNEDGVISLAERISAYMPIFGKKGRVLAYVATQASYDDQIAGRDPSFRQLQSSIFVNFATSLILDGIYQSYLSFAVSGAVKAAATQMVANPVLQFFLRKGMEASIKASYDAAVAGGHIQKRLDTLARPAN